MREREVSEIIRKLLDFHRGVLVSQKLKGYKEALNLLYKYGKCLER